MNEKKNRAFLPRKRNMWKKDAKIFFAHAWSTISEYILVASILIQWRQQSTTQHQLKRVKQELGL